MPQHPLRAPYDGLLAGSVDVVWGAVAPAPSSVDVTPLLEVERMAVVPSAHDLADAGDSRSVVHLLRPGQAAVVATGSWAASAEEPGLHHLRLADLPPLPVYAAHRHTDRREAVRSLVELLPQVAAEDTHPARATQQSRHDR